MTYNGRDVFKCKTLRSGIDIENPILDYAAAAQWWHMTWPDFEALDSATQAFKVAVFRTVRQIDAVIAYTQHRKSVQAAKQAAKRNKSGH